MAEPFNCMQKVENNECRVVVTGYVNENARFPTVEAVPHYKISLRRVSGLNSVGTRTWCDWLKTLPATAKISIDAAPAIFVKAFNQVDGALPKKCEVDSFFVPMYSDGTGERNDFLMMRGLHYSHEKGLIAEPQATDSAGKPMEMDIIPDTYFAFLLKL